MIENKLLVIPLSILFILTMIQAMGGTTAVFNYDIDNPSGVLTDDNGTHNVTVDVEGDGEGAYEYDIWGATGFMAVILAGFAISGIAGIKVLDSGLSEHSQIVIFNSVIWLGIWGILTAVTNEYFFGNDGLIGVFSSMAYVVITLMYGIGVVSEINGG